MSLKFKPELTPDWSESFTRDTGLTVQENYQDYLTYWTIRTMTELEAEISSLKEIALEHQSLLLNQQKQINKLKAPLSQVVTGSL